MARRKLIAGNWKMNPTSLDEATALATAVAAGAHEAPNGVDLLVIPPAPFLSAVGSALNPRVALGAQNLSTEVKGAFTGEVSGPILRAVGTTYVLCGHSERRQLFGESSELVGRKVQAALRDGLTPILCVGETLEEREAGTTEQMVEAQLEGGFPGSGQASVVIAYEPVWAIGTGKVATPEQAQAVHAFIRGWLSTRGATETAILYGGSVKADNAAELLSQADIDGALVGGASLDAKGFLAIAKAART